MRKKKQERRKKETKENRRKARTIDGKTERKIENEKGKKELKLKMKMKVHERMTEKNAKDINNYNNELHGHDRILIIL